MINYRNIFNPSYNYIGIIFIIIITLLIIIVQKDKIASIYKISKSALVAGFITLIIAIIINILIDIVITNSYKIFIQIISENVISNLYFYSILVIIIGGFINLITRAITNTNKY